MDFRRLSKRPEIFDEDPGLPVALALQFVLAFSLIGIAILIGGCAGSIKELDAPRKGVAVVIEH